MYAIVGNRAPRSAPSSSVVRLRAWRFSLTPFPLSLGLRVGLIFAVRSVLGDFPSPLPLSLGRGVRAKWEYPEVWAPALPRLRGSVELCRSAKPPLPRERGKGVRENSLAATVFKMRPTLSPEGEGQG